VYTLAALLALLPHLDRLGRLLRRGRRPVVTAGPFAMVHPPQAGDPH
jgi:2-keto-4-pentenoate hydratase